MHIKPRHLLILLVFLGLTLRIANLDAKPLWLDEQYSLETAENLYTVLTAFTTPDTTGYPQIFYTPPFYYILLHLAMGIGSDVFLLKLLFSVIPGILIIIVVYLLAKDLYGEKVALVSAFLVTIAPMAIILSQLLRYYALHTLFTLLSLLFLYRIMRSRDKISWTGFVIFNVLNLYTHYFAFFVIVGELAYVVWYRNAFDRKKIVIALSLIFILFAPWLIIISTQLPYFEPSSVERFTKTTPSEMVLYTLYKIPVGVRRPVTIDWIMTALLLVPLVYAISLFGIIKTTERRNLALALSIILSVILIPLLLHLFVSTIPLLSSRYQWFLFPLYFMVFAVGLNRLGAAHRRLDCGVLLFITIVFSVILYDYYFLLNGDSWSLLVGV